MANADIDIAQQFIDGGVIPADLVGQDAVTKKYVDDQLAIRDQSISAAANAAGAAQSDISEHKSSTKAHAAENIIYSGKVEGYNVKQALDNTNSRISNIVSQAGNDNTEIVDARGGYTVLRERLDASDQKKANKRWYDVMDYGAKGDGIQDDSAAFDLAISNLPSNGGVIKIPAGRYRLTKNITITDKDVTIIGDGIQQTQLFFESSDGIVYSTTNLFSDGLACQDLTLVTLADGSYVGIDVSYPDNIGSAWVNTIIERVVFSGSTSIDGYNDGSNNSQSGPNKWDRCISLNNSAVSFVSKCVFRQSTNPSGTGIHVSGWTVDLLIESCRFYGCGYGVYKKDPGEGLNIVDSVFVNVYRGVVVNETAVSQSGVWASIQNCHINYYLSGIMIRYQPQVFIDNCLIYKNSEETGGADILLENCERSKVTDNTLVVKFGSGSTNGVVLNDSIDVVLEGNIIQERETGLWVQDGCQGIYVSSSNRINRNSNNIIDQSNGGTYFEQRQHAFQSVQTLAAGQNKITFTIPSGLFTQKPEIALLFSSSSSQFIHGYYDYDASTETNLLFNILRNDNAPIVAETVRFNVSACE